MSCCYAFSRAKRYKLHTERMWRGQLRNGISIPPLNLDRNADRNMKGAACFPDYIIDGKKVAICGNRMSRPSTKITSTRKKGTKPIKMSLSVISGATPFKIYACTPTGGVSSAISISFTTMTPNHTPSKPSAWIAGATNGTVRNNIPKESRKQPMPVNAKMMATTTK